MDANDLRQWRPTKFSDFAGKKNQRRLARIQQPLLQGRLPSPLLLVSVYGYGKTSLARLSMKSLCCENRDPITADPCHKCQQCICYGLHYNGYGDPYRRFELDCTRHGRSELMEELNKHYFDQDKAIFMDEIHCLNDKTCQQVLLKFIEDFRGLFVAAIMEDRLNELIPPLQERLEILQLVPPSVDEMVDFFCLKAPEWKIQAGEVVIRSMVEKTNRSFRASLRILSTAAARDSVLTDDLIREVLNMDDDRQPH